MMKKLRAVLFIYMISIAVGLPK